MHVFWVCQMGMTVFEQQLTMKVVLPCLWGHWGIGHALPKAREEVASSFICCLGKGQRKE
jgi:hypothetical protein